MLSASALRRPAGLVAVAAMALSSALLTAGNAQAAPSGWTFDSSSIRTITVPHGTCAIDWTLIGASVDGQPGTERKVTTTVQPGEAFWLLPGDAFTGNSGDTAVNKNQTNYLVAAAPGGPTLVENGGAPIVPNPDRDSSGPAGTTSPTGSITGAGVACDVPPGGTEVPGAPVIGLASSGQVAGEISVYFDDAATTADTATVTGHEYSVDGGTWTPLTTWVGGFFDRSLTVTGLTPGRVYAVRVRAVSTAGPGAPSAEESVRAGVVRVGAPTQVEVTPGPSSLTVRWSPPTAAGTYPVDGYRVSVLGVWIDRIEGCSVGAGVRTCVVAVPAGGYYTVNVEAVDTLGLRGVVAAVGSGDVPAPEVPPTVPSKDGDLRGPAGATIDEVTVGKTVVLRGSGYAPFSTVRAVAYSTPTELGTFVTDANGDFEATVTIPADLPVGNHSLVVTGIDRQGQPRNLRVDVTVAAAAAPVITSARLEGTTARLASTGADVGVPLVGGLCAVVAGGGLLLAARRRATAGG